MYIHKDICNYIFEKYPGQEFSSYEEFKKFVIEKEEEYRIHNTIKIIQNLKPLLLPFINKTFTNQTRVENIPENSIIGPNETMDEVGDVMDCDSSNKRSFDGFKEDFGINLKKAKYF